VVVAIAAVAEAIDPQFPRIAAGHHTTPGRHRDGGDAALQATVATLGDQAAEMGQISPPVVKHQGGLHAIKANN